MQHDYVLDNAVGAAFRLDLNAALQAIVSNNSGPTEPATTYANQLWVDTASGYLKQRNSANTGWDIKGELDQDAIAALQGQLYTAFTTDGTATAYTLTPVPAISSNVANQRFRVNFHTAAGASPTMAINGKTALSLKYRDAAGVKRDITASQVPSGWVADVENDGADLVVLQVAYQEAVSAIGNTPFSHRNRIINPFEVNQRGLTTVGDDAYCLDRWYVLTESGTVSVAQVGDPEPGAPWAIRLTQPDAAPKRFGVATIIEAKDIKAFRSAAMNFFMRVKPSFAGNVRYAILEHTGTADSVTSDVVNNWGSATFAAGGFFIAGLNVIKTGAVAPGAATYGEFSDWGVMGATLNNAILFVWTESAQAQNATLELNRPQFEPGIIHTPHEWRQNELALCQRYYYRVTPAAVNQITCNSGVANGTTTAVGVVNFPVPMRATPTSLEQSGTAADYVVYNGSVIACSSVPTFNAMTTPTDGVINLTVASGLTSGQSIVARAAAASFNGYLGFPAEL